jgi:energy-coupling factor transporter ATP-binding protein EcfA2
MHDPLAEQSELLQSLRQIVAERAAVQARIDSAYRERKRAAEDALHIEKPALLAAVDKERKAAGQALEQAERQIAEQYGAAIAEAEAEADQAKQRSDATESAEREKLDQQFQEGKWTLGTLLEAAKSTDETAWRDFEKQVAAEISRDQETQDAMRQIMARWRVPLRKHTPVRTASKADPLERLQEAAAEGEECLAELRGLWLPRLFHGLRPILILVLLWALAVIPAGLLLGAQMNVEDWLARDPQWWVVVAASALGSAFVLTLMLFYVSRSRVYGVYGELCQAFYDARQARQACQEQAHAHQQKLQAELDARKKKHGEDLGKATVAYRHAQAELKARGDRERHQTESRRQTKLAAAAQRKAKDTSLHRERHEKRLAGCQSRLESELAQIEKRYREALAAAESERDRRTKEIEGKWRGVWTRTREGVSSLQQLAAAAAPAWNDGAWIAWQPPAVVAPALAIGRFRVNLEAEGFESIPADLKPFDLPLAVRFPRDGSVLYRATDAGRAAAVSSMQTLIARLLTTIPPGKARFTIIDPVGLGENFASFMHLADFEEALVSSRIWTEPPHIEQRLADLTAHMENVIQKYLRNQFATIEEYNVQAGEVAEAFRFLVVANFPTNFTAEAARRLVSIATGGARCGVYTIVSVDLRQPMPHGFNLADLQQAGVQLLWTDGRFTCANAGFEKVVLELDSPPAADRVNHILQRVGEAAREAKRVEVAFSFITPAPSRYWTGDTRSGIDVPIGRSGATKRQHITLGKDTKQHALIAGKTGSGKSTLLHVLITNLALTYSPDEIELYLVDFKKGVEFKTYAAQELPHARVIAVESEREFGLSVLQRLNAELTRRGEQYRGVGAQDVKGYREATGEPLPRILLLVDEFQEFFVEDDRIAQESAQLLDRLVRQGRAFGIHVVLGSQTLGGAYTLARSTIDQMGVRIALQCSEADAALILSEDNSAARLLSRPGEAIYNDANGLVEGNNPFQISWLDDEERDACLESAHRLAVERGQRPAAPAIVFEGNVPADAGKNAPLNEALRAAAWPAECKQLYAWLGESIAIKDPTAARFRRQNGSNLLLIGQQDEAALGICGTAILGLAAQIAPNGNGEATPTFYLLDGSTDTAPQAGFLPRMKDRVPHSCRGGGYRDAPVLVAQLQEELDRRLQSPDVEHAPVFLFVFGLQRFRDLRRDEDDYGYSGGDKPSTPAKMFTQLLRDGPALGIHSIVWCDNLNNLMRSLDRQAQREFDLRVVFQMSAGDSSNLIDSPLASKLGPNRAFFVSEEEGLLEKFRPYSRPGADWLRWAGEQLHGRLAAVER